ncbi:unnamed protein product [Arabidopsis halleri]
MKVPSIVELEYTNFSFGNNVDTRRCLVIDIPALENFSIYILGDSFSIREYAFSQVCIYQF